MTKITCKAINCEYNDKGGCRLGKIHVGGKGADSAKETNCRSFTDAFAAGAVDCKACDCACEDCKVNCDACNCKHNRDGECKADSITVGRADAYVAKETECRSFEKK